MIRRHSRRTKGEGAVRRSSSATIQPTRIYVTRSVLACLSCRRKQKQMVVIFAVFLSVWSVASRGLVCYAILQWSCCLSWAVKGSSLPLCPLIGSNASRGLVSFGLVATLPSTVNDLGASGSNSLYYLVWERWWAWEGKGKRSVVLSCPGDIKTQTYEGVASFFASISG